MSEHEKAAMARADEQRKARAESKELLSKLKTCSLEEQDELLRRVVEARKGKK